MTFVINLSRRMFWKNIYMPSRIDTLLDKENVTLEELLDEDDVVQECKSSNKKLIDFLIKPEVLEVLVNMMILAPTNEIDEKIRYKYPNIACDLLTSDVSPITEALATNEALLSTVYAFLEAEEPLNPLQASFFSKTMGLLITHKSEMMVNFIKSRDNFVGHLLRHLETSAIMDLLLRLITCIESIECRNNCLQWLNDQNLVALLVAMIDSSYSSEVHCNACQSLCDIIRLSRDQLSHIHDGPAAVDVLLLAIEKQKTVDELLNHMFIGDLSESVIVNGIYVLQALLETRRVSIEEMVSLDCNPASPSNSVIQAIIPKLKDFHQLLLNPPTQHYTPMPTSLGLVNKPLGLTRLQVVRLVSTLVAANSESINIQLSELGTIGLILNLFFQYPWNNFLHTEVEHCLTSILNCTLPENPLLSQLFKDFHLVERISETFENNQSLQVQPGHHRPGFLGHLTMVANHLVSKFSNTTIIFQELPDTVQVKWDLCVGTVLADVNKLNSIELGGSGGGSNTMISSSEDDDDFQCLSLPQDDALQKAFSDYQMQQMTSNFVEQFGFNEEDFAEPEEAIGSPFTERISSINFDLNAIEDNPSTAAMFEQACNDRIHQFDNADSDDELWEKDLTFSQISENRHSSAIPRNDNTRQEGNDEVEDYEEEEEDGLEGSDGSTDSEEDLDSPRWIRQMVKPSNGNEDIQETVLVANTEILVNGELSTDVSTLAHVNCQTELKETENSLNGSAADNVDTELNQLDDDNIFSSHAVDPNCDLPSQPSIADSSDLLSAIAVELIESNGIAVNDAVSCIGKDMNHIDECFSDNNKNDETIAASNKLLEFSDSIAIEDHSEVPSVEK